jgi:glycosyltransferase involved in cell wall biosynthesis
VVVPFLGPPSSLERLIAGMSRLELRADDTLTIVDNGGVGVAGNGRVRVVEAPERRSSYYARNRGAALGRADWLVFLDADVVPPPQLLDAYLAEAPNGRVGVLGGAIEDEPAGSDAPPAARFATLLGSMSQSNTLAGRSLAYTQTANCAIRRSAFEEVGGFRDDVRSGGDADICFRLREAGWEIEPRQEAAVVHSSRRELAKLLRQRARMGAGAAWVNDRHPGAFPPRRLLGLAAWSAGSFARAASNAVRGRRDEAILAGLNPLTVWAFELGRRLPNGAPDAPAANGRPTTMATTVPVSVVIPAYNRERMLRRALESVLAQRPAPAEIVVVDDASTDRTAAVAQELGATVVRHERNAGEGAARNSGIAAAGQPWIALLDSDDEWLPHHLASLWQARGDHVLVATSALRCHEDPTQDRLHGPAGSRPLVLGTPADIVFPENPVPGSAVLVGRDVAERAGGYGTRRHCADFDFLLRCLEQGTGVVLPELGVLYHVHPQQVSHARDEMKAAHTEIARSYADRPWFEPAQVRRWQTAVAWDAYRLDGGLRRAQALLRPRHLVPLLRLWWWRLRLRRRSGTLGRDGGPSVALLPGARAAASDGFVRVYDLRDRSRLAAFAALLRRPAGVAIAGSRLDALVARALGVRAIETED